MMLAELEAGAQGWGGTAPGADARRIAVKGPRGKGWLVGGRWVELPISRKMDPCGTAKWAAVQRLAAEVEHKGASIRLLCHCRWTRDPEAQGCRRCHCMPLAECIEREAARQRGGAMGKAAEAAIEAAVEERLTEAAVQRVMNYAATFSRGSLGDGQCEGRQSNDGDGSGSGSPGGGQQSGSAGSKGQQARGVAGASGRSADNTDNAKKQKRPRGKQKSQYVRHRDKKRQRTEGRGE